MGPTICDCCILLARGSFHKGVAALLVQMQRLRVMRLRLKRAYLHMLLTQRARAVEQR